MTKSERPFAFMPYGAPELQAVRRSFMVRGVAASSMVWIAVFVVASALLARFVSIPLPPAIIPVIDVSNAPEYQVEPPAENTPPTVKPRAADDGAVVPVRDDVAPPEDIIVPPHEGVGGSTEGAGEPDGYQGIIGSGAQSTVFVESEELPKRGDPIVADELPVLARDVKVVYPDLARDAGVEGRVIVHMLIGKDGRVLDAVVDPNHSIIMLDTAVLQAVRQMVFTPAFRNNRPVPVWVSRDYRFVLHSGTVE